MFFSGFSKKSVVFLLLLCFAAFLFAEDDLEFTVTAGRTPEEISGVAARVTVITAEDIASSGASGIVEVLEKTPGVRFSSALGGPGSESISMRGFGENSYGRVLVLVDGVKLNNPDMSSVNWNTVSLADIERIEIMDGSASVQYGNSAVGGVINIITKKTGESRTAINLSAGGFAGEYRKRFFENRESLAHYSAFSRGSFSVTVEHIGSAGYRDRQAARTMNTAIQGTIDLNDSLSLSLRASLASLYFQLPGGLTKDQYKDDPTKTWYNDDGNYPPSPHYVRNMNDENTEDHVSAGIGLSWLPLDNLEIQLPFSYTGKFIESDMASYETTSTYGGTPPSYINRTVHSGEARPQARYDLPLGNMALRILGGADFYYARLDNDTYNNKARNGDPNDFTVTQFTAGPWLTLRFDPLPLLTLNVGLRYDTAVITGKNDTVDDSKTHHALVYEGGGSVRPIEGLKLYARYASLFRYPFTDEQAALYGYSTDEFLSDLEAEKGFNVEGGVRYQLNGLFVLDANVFYMGLKDEIAYNPVARKNTNLDETSHFGVNVGLTATPIEYLELEGGYSFVQAKFTAGDNKDKRIPLVPLHTFSAALTGKIGGFRFGPNIEFRSDAYQGGDNANTGEKIDAYVLWGAFLGYSLEKDNRKFSLQIRAKNLLDTLYVNTVHYGAYYPGDGRSITVSASYSF